MFTQEDAETISGLTHQVSHLQQEVMTLQEELRRQSQVEKAYSMKLERRDSIINELRAAIHRLAGAGAATSGLSSTAATTLAGGTGDDVVGSGGGSGGPIEIVIPLSFMDEYERQQQELILTMGEKFEAAEKDAETTRTRLVAHYNSVIAAKDRLFIQKQLEYSNSISVLSGDYVAQVEALVQENLQHKEAAQTLRQDIMTELEDDTKRRITEATDELRATYSAEVSSLSMELMQRSAKMHTLQERLDATEEALKRLNLRLEHDNQNSVRLLSHLQLEYDTFISDVRDDHLAQVNILVQDSNSVRQDLEVLRSKHAEAEQRAEDILNDTERMRNEHEECGEKIRKLARETQEAQYRLADMTIAKEHQEEQARVMSIEKKELEDYLRRTRTHNSRLQKSLAEVTQKLTELEAESISVTGSYMSSVPNSSVVKDPALMSPSSAGDVSSNAGDDVATTGDRESPIGASVLEELRQELADAREENVQLSVRVERANKEIESHKNVVAEHAETISKLKAQLMDAKTAQAKSSAVSRQVRSEAKTKLEAELVSKLDRLQAQLDDRNDELQSIKLGSRRFGHYNVSTQTPIVEMTNRGTRAMTPERSLARVGSKSSFRRGVRRASTANGPMRSAAAADTQSPSTSFEVPGQYTFPEIDNEVTSNSSSVHTPIGRETATGKPTGGWASRRGSDVSVSPARSRRASATSSGSRHQHNVTPPVVRTTASRGVNTDQRWNRFVCTECSRRMTPAEIRSRSAPVTDRGRPVAALDAELAEKLSELERVGSADYQSKWRQAKSELKGAAASVFQRLQRDAAMQDARLARVQQSRHTRAQAEWSLVDKHVLLSTDDEVASVLQRQRATNRVGRQANSSSPVGTSVPMPSQSPAVNNVEGMSGGKGSNHSLVKRGTSPPPVRALEEAALPPDPRLASSPTAEFGVLPNFGDAAPRHNGPRGVAVPALRVARASSALSQQRGGSEAQLRGILSLAQKRKVSGGASRVPTASSPLTATPRPQSARSSGRGKSFGPRPTAPATPRPTTSAAVRRPAPAPEAAVVSGCVGFCAMGTSVSVPTPVPQPTPQRPQAASPAVAPTSSRPSTSMNVVRVHAATTEPLIDPNLEGDGVVNIVITSGAGEEPRPPTAAAVYRERVGGGMAFEEFAAKKKESRDMKPAAGPAKHARSSRRAESAF